jgi:CHAT domain
VTPDDGAVSLVVRHDPAQNAYRFEFRDEDNPAEVISHLAYQPGPRVEQLVTGLERLAGGRAGYSAAETRDYLINAGAGLWQELVPPQLRGQFWERRDRIGQLTILADSDTVPWELLYPFDRGYDDAGFLVEQFPVTRAVFGRRLSRSLNLSPAWFVLPDGSPAQAREEVSALLRMFGLQYAPEPVIGGLTPLLDLIKAGNFGLLHFACHNAFDADGGSAISLDRRQFTPTQLNTAAIGQVLAGSAPTVFINACRSAGTVPSYHQLDGWASKFLDAGAAAFIGSLWAVRDETARQFASELYQQLRTGAALGEAAMRARMAAAGTPGDPTWLAYAVYGDPRAALR